MGGRRKSGNERKSLNLNMNGKWHIHFHTIQINKQIMLHVQPPA